MGEACQHCRPGFVGNPANGGECVPCLDYCSGKTADCFPKRALRASYLISNSQFSSVSDPSISLRSEMSLRLLREKQETGMLPDVDEPVCVNCDGHTVGLRCEHCAHGYYVDSSSFCKPCECNGHGSVCDRHTGENCLCMNNTVTDLAECAALRRSRGAHVSCRKFQCSKCKDYFIGRPAGGHQCFRQMSVNADFCLDGDPLLTRENCDFKVINEYKNALSGAYDNLEASFFAVQPKFMNVDIRLYLDVTRGVGDVLVSSDSQLVRVSEAGEVIVDAERDLTFDNPNLSRDDPLFRPRSKRSIWIPPPRPEAKAPSPIRVIQKEAANDAASLSTFAVMDEPNMLLYVKNVSRRLVVSLPEASHDLRTTRFYVVIIPEAERGPLSFVGSVRFRQDQLHIDLFVFFSVFFSGFFLFLSFCVLAWQANASRRARRNRMLRATELENLSKRPFATQFLDIGLDDVCGGRGPKTIAVEPTFADDDSDTPRPVSVHTVLIQLPKDTLQSAMGKIAFGCALVETPRRRRRELSHEQQQQQQRRRRNSLSDTGFAGAGVDCGLLGSGPGGDQPIQTHD